MIPLAAVFAGILQHSHSTGFCSGALRAHYFPSPELRRIARHRLDGIFPCAKVSLL